MRIVLIGPMGAGKTTAGTSLSNQFNLPLYDTDRIIEQREKKTIVSIFHDHDESYFREIESAVLKEAALLPEAVICTGGGIVLNKANRKFLQDESCVIYLETSVSSQMERLIEDRSRPILNVDNKIKKLVELKKIRDTLYKEVAKITINTDGLSMQNVFKLITESLSLN